MGGGGILTGLTGLTGLTQSVAPRHLLKISREQRDMAGRVVARR
jgi:hypothetical protein